LRFPFVQIGMAEARQLLTAFPRPLATTPLGLSAQDIGLALEASPAGTGR
jgi:hypothetical protein